MSTPSDQSGITSAASSATTSAAPSTTPSAVTVAPAATGPAASTTPGAAPAGKKPSASPTPGSGNDNSAMAIAEQKKKEEQKEADRKSAMNSKPTYSLIEGAQQLAEVGTALGTQFDDLAKQAGKWLDGKMAQNDKMSKETMKQNQEAGAAIMQKPAAGQSPAAANPTTGASPTAGNDIELQPMSNTASSATSNAQLGAQFDATTAPEPPSGAGGPSPEGPELPSPSIAETSL